MKHAKVKERNLLPLWISLGAFFVVLIIAYFVGANYFSSHFGLNTYIDSTNVGLMTADEVKNNIRDSVDEYELHITGREGASRLVTAEDVGLVYVDDGQIQQILNEQNHWLWFTRLFINPATANTHASVRFDADRFHTILGNTDFYQDANMRAPANAYAAFVESAYVVNPEDLGTTLDKEKTQSAIYDALHSMAPTLNLEEKEVYSNPEIYSDNADLKQKVDTYNQYVPFSITYDFGTHTEVLDGSITMNWIDIDASGTGTFNEEAMEAWVTDFGSRYDTIGLPREFTAADGEVLTVEGGTYGWEIDEPAEIEAILNAYENHTGETREPYYVKRAAVRAAAGQPDWGTSYIELDLTDQHMYYIVDGNVEFESDVVTGRPGGSATPAGVYSILEMMSPATLTGEIQSNGKPEYRTRVSYWMRMTWAGHGFHDATWQPVFGGSRYTYAGSHGCINMPYSSAQTLYSLIEVGLPVISHH